MVMNTRWCFWPCFDCHKHHLRSVLSQSFPWGCCWGWAKPRLGKSAAIYILELVSFSCRPWSCNSASPKTWLTPRDQNIRHHTERINLYRFWIKILEDIKAIHFRTEQIYSAIILFLIFASTNIDWSVG